MKTFKEYGETVYALARYPKVGNNLVYPVLGLVGEAGEAAEKVKKLWRDFGITSDPTRVVSFTDDFARAGMVEEARKIVELREGLIKELGDVLWYVNAAAMELGITLEDVAEQNVNKLIDRTNRNVIHGSGDNR